METVQIFINNKAGSAKKDKLVDSIVSFLLQHDFKKENVQVIAPNSADEAVELAKKAAQEKIDLVIPLGGDGTINKICGGVFAGGAHSTIGILPAGTVNNVAKSLQIPLELEAALQNLLQGEVRHFDLATVNQHYMISSLTLGFLADIAKNVTSAEKRKWGPLAFVKDFCTVLWNNRTYHITVKTAHHTYSLRTKYLLITMTNTIAGQAGFAPTSEYDDGILNLFSLKEIHLLKLLWHLKDLRRGKFDQLTELSHIKAHELTIEPRKKQKRYNPQSRIDGDKSDALPLHITVHKQALKTIVPKTNKSDQ